MRSGVPTCFWCECPAARVTVYEHRLCYPSNEDQSRARPQDVRRVLVAVDYWQCTTGCPALDGVGVHRFTDEVLERLNDDRCRLACKEAEDNGVQAAMRALVTAVSTHDEGAQMMILRSVGANTDRCLVWCALEIARLQRDLERARSEN